jgi:Vitamin K-dependent gamma-carboxylase
VTTLPASPRRMWTHWERFWFAPQSTAPLAALRIAFALIVLAWAVSLSNGLFTFFSSDGLLTRQPRLDSIIYPGAWGLLGTFTSKSALVAVYVALLAAAFLLLIGLLTRGAALVVFLCLLMLMRRDPWVLNSGDILIRVLAFYVMIAPTGAALSVDRWVRTRRSGGAWLAFPLRSGWTLRLLQVQLSLIYLSAFWDKTGGETWRAGTAVSYAFRIGDLHRFPLPHWLLTSPDASTLMTYATLVVEFGLGFLVWNRVLRPWFLLAGVALHLGIDYTTRVGFFSYGVIALYLVFVPADRIEQIAYAIRRRLRAASESEVPSAAGAADTV